MFKKLLDKLKKKLEDKIEEWFDNLLPEETENEDPGYEEPQKNLGDEIDFSKLSFCWGGFNGSKASLTVNAISSLKIGSNLSYSVIADWFSLLGCASKSDANALACLFVKTGDSWKGGKFDWISQSRLTRDFKNIETKYGGWDPNAFHTAKEFAFVIVSKSGTKRTNVIHVSR